jgi:hypothetical protein
MTFLTAVKVQGIGQGVLDKIWRIGMNDLRDLSVVSSSRTRWPVTVFLGLSSPA